MKFDEHADHIQAERDHLCRVHHIVGFGREGGREGREGGREGGRRDEEGGKELRHTRENTLTFFEIRHVWEARHEGADDLL